MPQPIPKSKFGASPKVARVLWKQGSEHRVAEKILRGNVRQRGAEALSISTASLSVLRIVIAALRQCTAGCGGCERERIHSLPEEEIEFLFDTQGRNALGRIRNGLKIRDH